MWYIYTMKFYSALKKKVMNFADKGMELGKKYGKWDNQVQRDKTLAILSHT